MGSPGTPLTLGIRPEHVVLNTAGKISLTLEPGLEERHGADTLVHCRVAEAPDTSMVVRLDGDAAIPTDRFVATTSAFHLFDPGSGARL